MTSPDDTDGDFVDDLIQFEKDANHLENIQFLDPGIIDLAWDSEVDESNVKLADHHHNDRQSLTISEITASSATVKPCFIKLVDCFKFPTFFDKHTKNIIEKAVELHTTAKVITPMDVSFNDRQTVTSVNASDQIEFKSLGEGTKRLEAYKRKNDMEVKKAMSELNKTNVDLKKNKGLVGMRILQMPQISFLKKKSIVKTKINQDKAGHTIFDPLNVDDIYKILSKIGTSCTPVDNETPKGTNKIRLSKNSVDATKAETNIDPTTSVTTITSKQSPVTIQMIAKQNCTTQITDQIDNQEKTYVMSEHLKVQAVAEEIYRNVATHLGSKHIKRINNFSKPMPKSKKYEIYLQKRSKDAQTSLQPIKYLPILDETINKHVNSENLKGLYENKAKDLTFSDVTFLERSEKDSSGLNSNKAKKTNLVNITSQKKLKYPIVQADSNILNKPCNKFTKNVLRIAKRKKKTKICAIDNLQTFPQSKPIVDNLSTSCMKHNFEDKTGGSNNTCIPKLAFKPCSSNENHKERLKAIAKNSISIAESAVSDNPVNMNIKVKESKASRKQTITLVSDCERNVKDYVMFNENTKLKIPIEINTGLNKANSPGSPLDSRAQNQLIHTQNLSSPTHSRPINIQKCQTPVTDNQLTVCNSLEYHTLYRPPPSNAQLSPRVSPNITRNVQSPVSNQMNHLLCNTTLDIPHIDRNFKPSSNKSLFTVGKKSVKPPHTPVIASTNLEKIHGEIFTLDISGSHDKRATHKTTEYTKPEGFSIAPASMPLGLQKSHPPSQINRHSLSFDNEKPLLADEIKPDTTDNTSPRLAMVQNSLPPLEICKVGSDLVFWSPAFPPPNLPLSVPPPSFVPPLPHSTSIIGKNNDGVIRTINLKYTKIDPNNTELSKSTDNTKTQSKYRESSKQHFLKPNNLKRTDKTTKFTNLSHTCPDPKGLIAFEHSSRPRKNLGKTIYFEPVLDKADNIAVNDDGLIQAQNKIEQKMVQLFGEDSSIDLERVANAGSNKTELPQKQNADPVNLKRTSDDVQKKLTMYKPGPLSKKKKFNYPNNVRTNTNKRIYKGYSDPILPIPTFGEFLSMPYLYKFNDDVDIIDKKSEKIKNDVQTNSAKQLSLNKNTITKRRLTLEDYKKRSTNEKKRFEVNKASTEKHDKHKANDIARRTSNADSDLGYDSDNTVKL